MTAAKLHYVTGASDNRIAVERFPAGSAETVLLLHGGGLTRHSWRRAARRLQREGISAVTFDQRGHGDSDWAADGDYRPERFAADLVAVLRTVDGPVRLVGHSLGAYVALMVASAEPARVRGLVMVDTVPRVHRPELQRLVDFLSGDTAQGFATPADAARHFNRFFPRMGVTAATIEPALRRGADGRWQWHWDRRLVVGEQSSLILPYEEQLLDCARRVRCPFALVRAGLSPLVSDAAAAELAAAAPQLETVWLQDADHLLVDDEQLRVLDLVRGLLPAAAAPTLEEVR